MRVLDLLATNNPAGYRTCRSNLKTVGEATVHFESNCPIDTSLGEVNVTIDFPTPMTVN
jgi:hypothetical protein